MKENIDNLNSTSAFNMVSMLYLRCILMYLVSKLNLGKNIIYICIYLYLICILPLTVYGYVSYMGMVAILKYLCFFI